MSKAAPWEDDAPADTRAGAKAAPWDSDAAMPPRPARARLPRLPNGQIDTNSPEFKAANAATVADMTKEGGIADPTAGMNWGQKAIANFGAGVNELVQGGAQRLHDLGITDSGPTADDIAETRRQNQQLADRTTGGKALQITGNALPLVAAGLIPGMQGVAGGAALGALGGALTPTGEGESSLMNTAIGGGLGGAIPLALKGAGALWNKVSGRGAANATAADIAKAAAPDVQPAAAPTTSPIVGTVRGAFGETPDATGAAGEQQRIAQALADQLRAVQPTDVAGVHIPVSTGAALDNAGITRLEAGNRVGNAANWSDFKKQQAQAVADALRASTAGGEKLPALQAARSETWQRGMEDAMANANDTFEFAAQTAKLKNAIAERGVSPLAMRQGVPALLENASGRIEAMGDALTPQHLMEYRTGLNQGFSSPTGRLTSKDAALSALKGDYDAALNAITGGRTSDVINTFANASKGVDEAEAAQAVRQMFYTPEGRAATTRVFGDVPTITEARLGQAIRGQARPDRFGGGSYLSDEANQQLNSLLDVIVKNKNVEQLNKFATPEGSATAANLAAQKASEFAGNTLRQAFEAKTGPAGKLITGTIDVLAHGDTIRRDAMMARALQDPQYMADLMQQYAKSLGPNSRQADAVVQALRSLTVEGGTALTRK